MRRKHVARLGRAPANCNRRDAPAAPRALGGRPGDPDFDRDDLRDDLGAPGGTLDATAPDRPGYHGGVPCASCARKAATARQHQDRQLWILARELCASATLYGLGGRAPVALRTLRLAFTMLRGRAGTFDGPVARD
jgi:hypothetical protein